MRIAALTSGRTNPSARFRVRQHIPLLREAGMEVSEYCPAVLQGARLPGTLGRVRVRYLPPLVAGQIMLNLALRAPGIVGSYRADVTWLERNFVPGLDDAAVLLGKPLVLDIDDAIWLYNPLGKSQGHDWRAVPTWCLPATALLRTGVRSFAGTSGLFRPRSMPAALCPGPWGKSQTRHLSLAGPALPVISLT